MSSTASFLALSCVGFIASAPACADPLPDDEAQRHDDVVVTGRAEPKEANAKITAPLLDYPRSVVVLPREVIEQTGSNSLADALRTVPGITFGAAEGGNPIGDRPFIRGFDSQGSTFLDGVRDIGAQSREIFAVEQVQVVRGSDSTLGGRGSAGGTINIVSKMPQADTFATAALSYGNANYKRVTADVNAMLADNVAVRINGLFHDQDVAGRDAIFSDRWGVAPSIMLGVGGPTRLTAMYYHLHANELPDSGFPYAYVLSGTTDATPRGTAGLTYSEPALGRFTTAGGITGTVDPDSFYGLADRDFRRTDIDQATLRAEHDFGGVTLRNTARYGRTRQAYIFTQPDDSQANVFGIPAGNRAPGTNANTAGGRVWRRANTRFGETESLIDQLDLSGAFRTGPVRHSFAVGGEIGWEQAERGAYTVNTGTNNTATGGRCGTAPSVAPYNCADLFDPNPYDPWVNLNAAGQPTPIVPGGAETTTITDGTTRALWAFDSITLIPALIVNLGVRYEDFRSTVRLPLANGVRGEVGRQDDFVTYQAGVVFKPTPNTTLYASHSTSAVPPNALLGEGQEGNSLGTVASAAGQAAADALRIERSRSSELGAKADLFDGSLALTAALFRTETRNARVTSDANTVAFIGERRVEGVELGFNGRIADAWTVFGGYTFLDAVVVDGGHTAFTLPAGGGVAARTVLEPSVTTGRRFPQTARHSASLWTNYDFGRVELGGGVFHTGRVIGGYSDNRYVTGTGAAAQVVPATIVLARSVPAWWRFDLRAGADLNEHLTLSVNVQNLTDKRYFSQAYASHYATMAAGRTAFATLSVRY